MDYDDYRREMLSIQQPADLDERVFNRIVNNDEADKGHFLASAPKRRTAPEKASIASRLAACVLLVLCGSCALLATHAMQEPNDTAIARITRLGSEYVSIEASTAIAERQTLLLETTMTITLPLLSSEKEHLVSLSSEGGVLTVSTTDRGAEHRSSECWVKSDGGELAINLYLSVELGASSNPRLLEDSAESIAYRDYVILAKTLDSLERAELCILNESTYTERRYRFDVDGFRDTWDSESAMRKGGPMRIRLERME